MPGLRRALAARLLEYERELTTVRHASSQQVIDRTREITTRFTFDKSNENYPLWAPDGRSIAYVSWDDEQLARDELGRAPDDVGVAERGEDAVAALDDQQRESVGREAGERLLAGRRAEAKRHSDGETTPWRPNTSRSTTRTRSPAVGRRGTVGTGRVERGKVKVGDKVEIVGLRDTRETVVTGVEMFRKSMDEAIAGDNIGLLLRGIEKEDLERGMVVCAPKSITPHTKFKAQVYILNKDEGGRHTPFFKGYRPQFYFRTTDVTGSCELPAGTEMVMPGDNIKMVVELIAPIAMEEGLRFAIREGGRTVGAGVVSKVLK